MEKTVVRKLIDDLNEIDKRDIKLTNKGIISMLEIALEREHSQIIKAFEDGVAYGNSELQTFDNPSSRYYSVKYGDIKQPK